MTDQIDFAEHGRLLECVAAKLRAWDVAISSGSRDAAKKASREYSDACHAASIASRNSIDAYRAVVLAAKAFRDAVKPVDGRMNVLAMDAACKVLDAALARFKNITEAKP